MAVSSTLATILRRAIREIEAGEVCVLADATTALTALATGSVTVPSFAQDTNKGSGHYRSRNTVIVRMTAASVADCERYSGDLTNSSGLIAHTGANYADTTVGTEVVYLLYWGVRVADLLDALNRAMQKVTFPTRIALSQLSDLDGDMVVSTDTNWTDVLTPTTSAKSTTARRTPYGVRSYNTVGNAVNEGTQTATLSVITNKRVKGFTIASTNVGTSSLRFYDITNSAAADTAAITTSEEEPMLMEQDWQVVSTTATECAMRMINTSATGDTFWNMAWIFKEDNLQLPLPSYVTEHYQVPTIFQARPRGGEIANGVYSATDMEFIELVENRDYFLHFSQPDANPSAVNFTSPRYFDWPLFVQAKVRYSELVTFGFDEAATTTAPLNELLPRFKRELLDSVYGGKMPVDQWARMSVMLGTLPGTELIRSQVSRPTPKVAQKAGWAGMNRIRG